MHQFADKGLYSQTYGFFPYGCDSWTIKKAELQRTDAFELWHWRRFFRVLWTARRSNQSILKDINPEYSFWRTDAEAEAPVLWPPDALEKKDSVNGKDWRQKERGETESKMVGWHYRLSEHEFEQTRETVKDRETWRTAVHGIGKSQTWLSNWTNNMITVNHILKIN